MALALFTPFEGSHKTPVGQCAKALFLGAMAGAAVTSLPCIIMPLMAFYVFPVAFLIWLAGMFFVAAPLWAVLHLVGLRSLPVAILLGAVAAPAGLMTGMWFLAGRPSLVGVPTDVLAPNLLLLLAGAAAATVVWRKAYLGSVLSDGTKEKGGTVSDPAPPIVLAE